MSVNQYDSTGAKKTSTNLTQLAGTTIDTNSGNKSAGTLRIVIATDQPQFTTPLNTAGTLYDYLTTAQGQQVASSTEDFLPATAVQSVNPSLYQGSNGFVRMPDLLEKTKTSQSITSGGATTTVTVGATTGLNVGDLVLLTGGTSELKKAIVVTPTTITFATVNGTTHTTAAWDSFNVLGPTSNSINPWGIQLSSLVLADPLTSGNYYIATAARQDGLAGQSVLSAHGYLWDSPNANYTRARFASGDALTTGIAASAGMLWNGASWDRPKGDTTSGLYTQVRGWFGSTAPTVGSKTSANSIPVVVASDQGAIPVSQSGTWTVQPGNTANTTPWLTTISQGGNSATVTAGNALKVDGSAVTQPVSGTVTANIGTSGSLALDASVTGLQVSQGSTTSGQKGGLTLGAVTTAAPAYTTAQTSPLSLTTAGALRVDASGTTQPVSGTVTANQGTSPWVTNVSQINGVTPLMGNGVTGTGSQRVTIASDNTAFSVNATLQTGANVIGALTANQSVNVNQVAGGTVTTVATGTQKVGIADSAGTAFLSAANALNSTGGGVQASQVVAQFDDVAPTAITENQFGNLRMSANRNAYTTIRDAAGNERGVNVDATNRLSVSIDNSNVSTNIAQMNGVTVTMGNGVSGTGVQRVTIASDSTGNIGVGQGSTTSGQIGPLGQGAVTTAAPTYTTAQTSPLSLTTGGGLRADIASVGGTATTLGQKTMASSFPVVIASDQTSVPMSNSVVAATSANWTSATALNAAVTLSVLNQNTAAITFNPSGSITGGVATFEGSDDSGTTWYGIQAFKTDPINSGIAADKTVSLTQATGILWQVNVAGYTNIRVRLSTVITGTGNVTFRIQASSAVLGAFSGVNLTQINGVQIAASTDANSQNVMKVQVANSNNDGIGQIANGTNTTGTGSLLVGPIAQFDDVAPGTITENQFGSLRISTNRNLYNTIRDAAGNERGANVNASNQLGVIDASTVAQGSTTSGQSGGLVQAAVTTAAPAYTTAQTSPLSLTTAGNLRAVDLSTVAQGSTTSGQSGGLTQGAVTTAAPAYTTAQTSPLSLTTAGNLRTVDLATVAQASTTSGQSGPLVQGAVTTAAPAYTTAQTSPLSLTTAGSIRTDINSVVGTTATVNNGTTTAGTLRVTVSSDSTGQIIARGDVASGVANSGNPLQNGGIGLTALPTAVTTGQRVGQMLDVFGRAISYPVAPRNLITVQQTTITTTTETTVLTAGGAGVFLDVIGCMIADTAGTASDVTFRDSTGGTSRWHVELGNSTSSTTPYFFPVPFPQATANNNWTAQLGTALTSVIITMIAVQNK